MAKTYDEHVVDEVAAAKKRTDEFSTQRKAQADEAVKTSDSLYDTAIATAEKNYNASAEETENSYRSVYDANAVDELVARRNTAEAMANMGLTDSGLNATQQTAISLMRGRADSKATQQKQAAVDAIMRELDNARAQYNAEKTAASADIYAQADADILNFRNSADAAAMQNAAALYAADQEAIAAQYAADQEAATKQAQMLLDAQAASAEQELKRQQMIADYAVENNMKYADAERIFSGEAAAAEAQKAAAMSNSGTPSYTAINAQAMIYAKTSPQKAAEYIEKQYNAGYITDKQKGELLRKYGAVAGYDYNSVVERLESDKKNEQARIRNSYGTFEKYAAQMINKAMIYGGMSEAQAAQLIQQYGLKESDLDVDI